MYRRGQGGLLGRIGRKVGGIALKIGGSGVGKALSSSGNPLAQIGGAIIEQASTGAGDILTQAEDPSTTATMQKIVEEAEGSPMMDHTRQQSPTKEPTKPNTSNRKRKAEEGVSAAGVTVQPKRRRRGAKSKYFSIFD